MKKENQMFNHLITSMKVREKTNVVVAIFLNIDLYCFDYGIVLIDITSAQD